MIGRLLWDVSPTIRRERIRAALPQGDGRPREAGVRELHRPGAPRRWHEVRAFPLGDGIGVSFRDATERKAVLERLGQREPSFSGSRRSVASGACASTSAAALAGYRSPGISADPRPARRTRRSSRTTTGSRRIHPEDREARSPISSARSRATGATYVSEYRIVRPSDGAVRWIRALGRNRAGRRRAAGRPGRRPQRHHRTEARRAGGGRERGAAPRDRRRPARADLLHRQRPGVPLRQQDLRDLVRAAAQRDRRAAGRRGDAARHVRGAARRTSSGRSPARTVTYEVEFPRPHGLAFTEVVHVPHRDAAGRVLGVYVIVTDITQRKLAERALAESEARFRAIANSAPVLIWVTGADGDARIRQPGLSRLFRRNLRGGARLRLARGAAPRRPAADPRRPRRPSTPTTQVGRRRGPLPARRRALALAAGRNRSRAGASPANTSATSGSPTTSPTPGGRSGRSPGSTRRWSGASRSAPPQLAASEALVRTFFQHSAECHAVLVEDGDGFRFQEINPALVAALRHAARRGDRADDGGGAGPGLGGRGRPATCSACLASGGTYRYERLQAGRVVEAVATAVPSATAGRAASSSAPATSPTAAGSRSSCGRRRRWRRSASSPAASRTISTTC